MTEPNQTLDSRREQRQFEQQSEQMLQESSKNLHRIATSGLEIWQGYMSLGGSLLQAWCDGLKTARSSIKQMTSSDQNQNQNQRRGS